jgi:hypothetical protein
MPVCTGAWRQDSVQARMSNFATTEQGDELMDFAGFMKKEWKVVLLIICLIAGIAYLSAINGRLSALERQNSKIISTFDSIESVAITTDAGMNEMSKVVDKIESEVSYIVKKVRRR